ncbi:MAG: protein translocase subunit SecD [Hyphomonadaceae bacterium]|nr:protein translocase subunit SecD [Clostridia bacterium]
MASRSIGKFLLVTAIIALLGYVAMAGLPFQIFGKTVPSVFDEQRGIKRGLDLVGGSVMTYEAQTDKVTPNDMKTVISIMRKRLDNLGHLEATIAQQGEKKVRIEIPQVFDVEQAKKDLGQMAELRFVDADGNTLLSGKDDIVDAQEKYGAVNDNGKSEYYVLITLSKGAVAKFSAATEKAASPEYVSAKKNFIGIMMDEKVISQPSVSTKIDTESVIISGSFTAETTKSYAGLIRAGKLPFKMEVVNSNSIGPTLGKDALSSSLKAGLVGIILVMLFMLFFYRLPGLIANIALVAYIAIMTILMMLGKNFVTLTLPGFAGIILSIGIAVDANVIIFERVKEELKLGKTLRSAMSAGFSRAMTAVIDANVTTVIASLVLYFLGTGPIKGFAITLLLGVVVSMFTAIVVTRYLLEQMVGMHIKNTKLYGA